MEAFTRRSFLSTTLFTSLSLAACGFSPAPAGGLDDLSLGDAGQPGGAGRRRGAPTAGSLLTPPLTLAVSSALSEDYLPVNSQIVAQDDRVAAFATSGGTEAVVFQNKTLWHLKLDTSSAGGWTMLAIDGASEVIDYVVAPRTAGQDNATAILYYRNQGGVVVRYLDSAGNWSPPPSGEPSSLDWTTPLQSGYSGAGDLLVYTFDPAAFEINYCLYTTTGLQQGTLTGVTGVGSLDSVILASPSDQLMYVYAAGASRELLVWSVAPGPGKVPVGAPLATPQLPGGYSCDLVVTSFVNVLGAVPVVEDQEGSLWTFAPPRSPESHITRIWDAASFGPTGRAVEGVNLGLPGQNQLLDLYVPTVKGLFVLHQVDQGPTANLMQPVYAPPLPLRTDVVIASAPAGLASAATTLFTTGLDGSITIMNRPSSDEAWSTASVNLPQTSSLQQVDTYRTQLTLTDSNGLPAANTALSLTADQSILAFLPVPTDSPAGPATATLASTPVSITTDSTGRVSLAVQAQDLNTPQITVTATGLAPVTFNPAGDVHAFLNGTRPLNYIEPLSASTLTSATVDGQALAPGLTNDAATKAVGGITGAMAIGTGVNPPGGAAPNLGVISAGRPVRVAGQSIDLSKYAHDVWHAVKTGAAKVDSFAHDFEQKLVSITLTLEGWGEQALQFVIKTVDDALNFAHSVLNTLKADADKVLNWLKAEVAALLTDAVALAKQMRAWLGEYPAYLSAQAERMKVDIDGYFKTLEGDISTALGKAPTGTLQSMAQPPNQTPAAPGAPRAAANTDPSSFSGNCHAQWLFHKLGSDFGGGAWPSVAALTAANGNLGSLIKQEGATLGKDLETFWNSLVGPKSSASNFKGLSATIFTAELGKLLSGLVNFADAIADGFLTALEAAAAGLDALLSVKADQLPLIGPLLKIAGMDSVDLGELVCLVVAFPATFIYKLSHGAQAKILPSSSDGARAGAGDSSWHTALSYLAVAAQGLWAFVDTSIDVIGEDNKFFDIFDIVMPLLIGAFTWPGQVTFPSGQPVLLDVKQVFTDADTAWVFANWLLGLVPPLFSAGTLLDEAIRKIARFTDSGPFILCVLGGWQICFGAITNLETSANGGAWAATILGGLTLFCAFLGDVDVKETTEDISLVVKIVVDFFCGIGCAVGMAYAD